MIKMKKFVYFLAVIMSLSSCNSENSQSFAVPLSPNDIISLDNPFIVPWTPNLTKSLNGHPVIIGVITFDGTWNDKYNLSKNERETIEGHIYDITKNNRLIKIRHYYKGAGTQSNIFLSSIDAAIGYSLKNTSEYSAKTVISEIDELRKLNPNSDVRLLVSGFSRGGAAARNFMNEFEKLWVSKTRQGSHPKFYALIFDTVQSQLIKNLDMSVPEDADIFYHFVSEDERRILFKSVIDSPENDPDKRVVTIMRPGVHSDIGASYMRGIGSEYIADVDALLTGMGLLTPNLCQTVIDNARSQGKNDSRWLIERILGISAPNISKYVNNRRITSVPIAPMSTNKREEWKRRISALEFDNNLSRTTCTNKNYYVLPRFLIKFVKNDFIVSVGPNRYFWNPKIYESENKYILEWTTPIGESIVNVSTKVIGIVKQNKLSSLDLGIVDHENGSMKFWWFVDGIRYEEINGEFRSDN